MGASSGEVGSCGNTLLERPSEECDDGNLRDLDGCTSLCLLERGICGDGIVQSLLSEQCEPSLHDPSLPYQCIRCRFLSQFCGDGKLDPGEECDGGIRNSNAPVTLSLSKGDVACRLDCSFPRCSDGILDAGEECDDGNRLMGDGCDTSCRREAAAAPAPVPSDISPYAFLSPYQLPGVSYQLSEEQQNLTPESWKLKARPLPQQTAETGPEIIAIMAAGAAGGLAWMRRKRG